MPDVAFTLSLDEAKAIVTCLGAQAISGRDNRRRWLALEDKILAAIERAERTVSSTAQAPHLIPDGVS